MPRKEQFSGCLVGQSLGDALGFPVEGYPPSICQRYVQQVLVGGKVGEWSRYPYPFGQYSDDTQLARTLMESMLACRAFDPADYARRLALLFKEETIVSPGKSTAEAAGRLLDGLPWKRSGTLPPSAGNGSAVRAAPIGLAFHARPDVLIQNARDQSWITHQDPRCQAGSVALAGAVALALGLEGRPVDPDAFLNQLIRWTAPVDAGLSESLDSLSLWLKLSLEEAASLISKAGLDMQYMDNWPGISPYVVSSVLWSLYAFLKSPEDYWTAMHIAIGVGGDVDSTAAMTGAISGAYLGLEALPAAWTATLHDGEHWHAGDLVTLAESFYALAAGLNPA